MLILKKNQIRVIMVMSRELDLNSNKRFGDKKRKLEMVVETAQKIWG